MKGGFKVQIHTVQAGESLWSIANAYGVSVNILIEINALEDLPYLIPGQALIIPGASQPFGTIEVNAYMNPLGNQEDTETINSVGRYLTYMAPFSYQVKEDGTLTAPADTLALEAAVNNNTAPLMVLTNFREGNFDAQLVHAILISEDLQDTLIENILEVLEDKEYYGLNIDFERIPSEDRELYNDFLRRVVDELRPYGYPVSTALAPKPYDIKEGAWHGAHDYQAHGEILDFVIVMTYEYGWAGGPPRAVAPINEIRKVLDYATSVMPAEKIMMGMPLYGYDWTLPYDPDRDWAISISPQEALQVAAQYGATIQYDNVAQAPYFNYWYGGEEHVVWFEDARSVRSKLFLVDEYGLKGVSYWVLGFDFPQNWSVLADMYDIEKIVD